MAANGRSVLIKEKEIQGFTRISDPLEIHRSLHRMIEIAAKVDIRINDSSVRFQGVVLDTSSIESGLRVEAPESVKVEELSAPTTGAMIIAFMRGQNLLCVHAQNAKWEERVLTISSPWTLFKLQRRKEPRYQIPAAYDLFVTMHALDGASRRIKRRVLDISETGMGFQVASTREAAPYKKGLFLKSMEVIIENRQIFFDARIANVIPISNDRHRAGVKVGVEVIRMSPVDRHFIAAYVARNLVQIYT
jgi:c-di-GMP-binding flagellar brake protein YcgR